MICICRDVTDLYLRLVSGSDVADGPAGLLFDALLLTAEQVTQAGQRLAAQDDLRLEVVPSGDVTDGPQSRADHTLLTVPGDGATAASVQNSPKDSGIDQV